MPRETLEETPYILRDSKKLNRAKRNVLRDYIEENAIDFSVASVDNDTIDKVNILNASHMAMHKGISGLNVENLNFYLWTVIGLTLILIQMGNS